MTDRSRFIIGVDLGTTNCAVSYIDTNEKKSSAKIFRIPQFNGQKMVEELPLLPSFYYFTDPLEMQESLPWEKGPKDFVVGLLAEKEGLKVPTKLVASAKSWLSNKTCGRKEKILPFESADPNRKISPVEASSAFLDHIRRAWNAHFAKRDANFEFEQQEIIITVPASFDEVARTLTIEAAHKAGILHFTLLEEPQAAFYSWLMDHEKDYASFFHAENTILVCDIGGGTCDFSLIKAAGVNGKLEFHRMSVGPHLLLGGDNMDIAICHFVENQNKEELDASQWLSLRFLAKSAKEFLLNAKEKTPYSFWVPGKGSKVVGGGFGVQLDSETLQNLLAEGFFGVYDFEEAICLKQESSIRSMGLNYEADPSITKHLASFLYKSKIDIKPTYLLFNGGAMKPRLFQQRIAKSIDHWFPKENDIQVLESHSLDLAVARGACYFGKAKRNEGIAIAGGIPRSYYLKMHVDEAASPQALTLCERGTKEGSEYIFAHLFSLTTNKPISFQLLQSNTRLGDKREQLVNIDPEEMASLPPLASVLKFGNEKCDSVPVKLKLRFTELGILELFLLSVNTDHVWKLEFQLQVEVRKQELTPEHIVDDHLIEKAQKEMREAFATHNLGKLKGVIAALEAVLQMPKNEWPLSVLRRLYDQLLETAEKRHLASVYASRFWNLLGFCLRPGIGFPLDDYRIKEAWKLILNDFKKPPSDEVDIQKWIVYRRISAGLNKGQQLQIFNEIFPLVYNQKQKKWILESKKNRYAFEEKLRAIASLELVDLSLKIKLGALLLNKILMGNSTGAEYWALGRIGARQLLYGGLQHVIPKEMCEKWVEELIHTPAAEHPELVFLIALLSKKTAHREVNLSQKTQTLAETFLKKKGADGNLSEIIEMQLQEKMFGDSLPSGLTLMSQLAQNS